MFQTKVYPEIMILFDFAPGDTAKASFRFEGARVWRNLRQKFN
jgi:hypothetical protein